MLLPLINEVESYSSSNKDVHTNIHELPDHTEKSPSRVPDSRNPRPVSFPEKVWMKVKIYPDLHLYFMNDPQSQKFGESEQEFFMFH